MLVLGLVMGLPGVLPAQNLVPNGGFETYRNCPLLDNLLEEAVPWYNPNKATPDFYHACDVQRQLPIRARTGQGFARLFLDQGWGEYLGVELKQPLRAGVCYYYEMYVAMDTPGKYLTQTLGAYVSAQPLRSNTPERMSAVPQVLDTRLSRSDPALTWEKVSGFVNAQGGERYLTIGSFYKEPAFLGFYYIYIDDVSLQPINLDLGRDTTLCSRKSTYRLDATVPGATRYVWNDGSTDPTLVVRKPGRYAVTVTTDCKTLKDSIKVDYALDFALGPDTTLCNGQSLTLTVPVNGSASYQWQDGTAQNRYVVTGPGQYSVRVQQASCTAADTIRVKYIRPPELDLGPDKELCGAETYTIKPTVGQGQFAWADQTSGVERTVGSSGVYRASVQNACATVTDSIVIDYEACGCQLYAPTAFSPNGDGVNDQFSAVGCGDIAQLSLAVYSRWGELLFYTDKPPFAWNGLYRGQVCPAGVYAWSIEYRLKQHHGITLKRQQGALSLVH